MSSEDHDVVIPIPDGSSHAHPDLSAHYAHHQPSHDKGSHDDPSYHGEPGQRDDEPPPSPLEATARADLPQQLLVSPTPQRAADRQGHQHRAVAEPFHTVAPARTDVMMTAAGDDASEPHPHPQPLMRHMQQMPPQRGSTLPYAAAAPRHTLSDSLTSPGEASSGVNTALPLNSVADEGLAMADTAASHLIADGGATAATAFHPPADHHSGGVEVDGGIGGGRGDIGAEILDGRSRSNDEMSEVVDGSFCMPPSPSILPTKAPDGRSDSARVAAFANAVDSQSVRSDSAQSPVSSRQSPGPISSRQSPVSHFRQSHRNATPDPFGHLHDSQSSLRSPQFGSTLHLPRYRQHPQQQQTTPAASSGFPSALNLRHPPGASAPSRRSFIRQDSGDPLNRRVSGEAVESAVGALDDDEQDETRSDARSITPTNSAQQGGAKPSFRSGGGDRRGTSGGLDAKSRQENDKEREKEKKKELFSHFGSSADFMRSLGMKETTIERAVSSVSSRRTSPRFGESTHSTGSSPKAVDRRSNSSSDSPKANNQPPRPLNAQPQQRDHSTQQHEVKMHHRLSEDGRVTQRDSNGDTEEGGKQRSTNPGAATQQGQKKRSPMQELLFMHEEKLRLEALGKAPPVPPFGSVPSDLATLDHRRISPARSPMLTTSMTSASLTTAPGMHHPPKTTTVATAAASTPATPKSPISVSSPFVSNTLLVGASSTSGASSKFAAKHDRDDRGDRNTVTTTGVHVGVLSNAPRPTSPTGSPRRPTPTSLQDGFGRTPFEAFRMQLVRLCKDHNVDLLRDAGMRDYSSVKVLPPSPRPQQHGSGSTGATDPNAMSPKSEKTSTEVEPTPAKSDAASPLSPLSAALRNISSAASGKRPRRSFSASASVSATGGVSTGMARTSSFIQRPKDRQFWSSGPEEMDPAEAAAAAVVARRRGRQHSVTSPTSKSTKTSDSAGGATDGPDDFSMSMSGRGGRRRSLTTPLSPASPSGARFVPTRSLAQLRTDGTLILQHHARPTSPAQPKATFESALNGGLNNKDDDDGEAASMSATFRGELELFQKGMLTTLRQRPSVTDSSPPRGAHDDSDAEGNGDDDDDADAHRRSSTHGTAGQDHKSWWRSDDKRPTGYTHSKRAASTAAKDSLRSAVARDPTLAQFARLAKMSKSPFSQDAASSAFDSPRQESSSLRQQATLQYGRKSAVTVVSPRREEASIRGKVDPGVFSPRKSTNTKGRESAGDDTDLTSSTATSTRSSFSGADGGAGGDGRRSSGGDSAAMTSPANRFTNLSAGQSQPGFLRLDGRSDDPSVVDNERHRHRRDADKDTSRPASTDGGPQHPTPSTAKESRSSSTKRSARVTMTDCHEGRDRTPGGGRSDRGSHEPSRGERHHGVPDRSLLSEEEKEREEVRAWFVDEYHRRVDPTTEVPVLYAGSHSHPGSRAVAQPIQPSDLDDIYSSVGLHRQNASRNGAVLMSPAIKATTATVGGRSTTPRSVTAKLTSAGVRTSPSTGTARLPRTEGDTRATPTARVRHHKQGSSTSSTTDGGTFSSSDDNNENEGRCGTTMSELELTRSGDTDDDQSTDSLELYERQLNERAVISETLTAREKEMIRSQLAAPAERRNASTRNMYTKVTELPMPPTPPELLVGTHQGRRDAERAAELEERAAVTQLCSLKETARRTGVLKTFAGGGFSAVGDGTSRYNAASAAVVYDTTRGRMHGPNGSRGNDGEQHTTSPPPGISGGSRGSAAAEADATAAARSALHKRTSLDAEVAALSRRQLKAHAAGSSSGLVKEELSEMKPNSGVDRDPASISQHQGMQLHPDVSSGAFAPSSAGTIGGRDQQRSALTSPSRNLASPTPTATNGARRVSASGAQNRTGATPLDNDTFDAPPSSRVRRVSLGGELASPTAITDSPEDRSSGRRSPTSAAASAASFARLIAGETAAPSSAKHDGGASHPTRGNRTSGVAKKQDAATKLKAYTAFSEEVLETEDDGVDSLASPPQVDLALPTPSAAARNGPAAKGASRGGAGAGQHAYQTSQAHSRRAPTRAESFLANGFAGATSHQEFLDAGDTTFEFDALDATGRPENSNRHMFNFNAAPRSQVIAAQCKRLAMKTFEAPPAQMTAYAVGDPMRTRGRERLGPARLSSKTTVQESLDHRAARRRGCCSKSPPPNAPRGPEWTKPGQSIIAGTFTIDESSYPYPDDNDDDAASLGGHQNSGLGNQRSSLLGGGARSGRAQTLGQIPSLSGLTDSSRQAGSMQRLPRRNSPPSPNSRASPSSHDEDADTNDTPPDDDEGGQDGMRSRDEENGTSRRNSPVSASAVASRTQSRMKASSSRSLGGDLGSGEGSKVTLRTTASTRTARSAKDNVGNGDNDSDQDRGDGARSPGSLAVEESDRWSTASPSGIVRPRSRGAGSRGGGGLAAAKSRTSVTIDDRAVRQQGGDAPSPRSGATSRAHSFFSQNAESAVSNDDRDEPHQAMQPSARTDRSRAASVQQQPDRDRTPRQNESEGDIFGQHLDLGGDDDDDEDDNDHASQRAEVGRSFRMALRDPAARHDPRDSCDVRPDAILGRTESTLTRMSARSGTSTRTGYLAGLASRRSSRAGGGLTPRRSPPTSGLNIPSTPALYSQRKRRDGGRGASGAAGDHSASPSLSPQPSRRALRNNDVDDATDGASPRREGSMSPSPTPASRGLNTPSSPRDAATPGFGREATEPPFDDRADHLLDDVSMPMSPTQRTPRGAVASPRDMSPRRRATLELQPSSRFVDPTLDGRGPTSAPTTPRGDTAARRLPPRRQPPASRQ